ncbi:transcriptional regulator [Actinobacillus porcinus]|uniref:transcriptional regulator n=1 Tax=Actinobacillus porcinus TaxID=51048 RepID=UPI002A910E86|nr:Cro/CI family transcriptional regulator [Actinobacillus porcinus]MDY6216696.1 Cro/CI family transcriptional regulator [Actinobacillus porcinus]
MNELIAKAIKLLKSQTKLAEVCEVTQGAVRKWLNGGEYSAKYAARIEKATNGEITAKELCQALDDIKKQGATK